MDIKLPIKDIFITQPFGVNYLDFYQKMGLKGHPGIDFMAKHGCPIMAAHDGIISWCGNGRDGGIGIELLGEGFKTFYYHHLKNGDKIQKGVEVGQGEVIAYADNTGKYTTGDHLHFELYFVDSKGITLNKDNGFGGSVDPAPYFVESVGKDWTKPAAYHRYGREQVWIAEWKMRFKNYWLHKELKKYGQIDKIYDTEFINALVYGGWDFATTINPAMRNLWTNLKKDEYLKGEKPYLR